MRWKTINPRRPETPPPPNRTKKQSNSNNSHLDIKVKLLKTNGEGKKIQEKNLGVIQEKKRHLQRNVWCELRQTSHWDYASQKTMGGIFQVLGGDGGRGRGKGHKPLSAQNLLLSKNIFEIWAFNKDLFRKKLIEFVVSRPVLQEMLKFFSQKNITEGTLDPHKEMKSSSQ